MQEPLVSLMTPVRDREHMLCDTVDSLLSQTYPNTEIILVESGSTDHSWEVCVEYAEKYKNVIAYKIEKIGQYPAYQACVNIAHGEYGCFVWSDDTINENHVSNLIELFDDQTAFAYSSVIIGDGYGSGYVAYKRSGEVQYVNSRQWCEETLHNIGANPVSPGCAMFRVKDMGIFDMKVPKNVEPVFEHPEAGLDIALFILTAKKYPKVAFSPVPTAYFRKHPGSITIAYREKVMAKYALICDWLRN